MIKSPNDPEADVEAATFKSLVAVIPFLGHPLVEVIGSFYEKRRNEWMDEVTEEINRIAERLRVLPEDLFQDEAYLSFFMQATLVAMKKTTKKRNARRSKEPYRVSRRANHPTTLHSSFCDLSMSSAFNTLASCRLCETESRNSQHVTA
jgi:hypothetical protein